MDRMIYKNNLRIKAEKELIVKEQLSLFIEEKIKYKSESTYDKLIELLRSDLDFHNQLSNYSSHNFHSFPAKFPPQLPKLFIEELSEQGEVILDPMVGSGTTMLEAYLANRKGIGFDIDPLAIKIATVKTKSLNKKEVIDYGIKIYNNAKIDYTENREHLLILLNEYFEPKTIEFLDYWFLKETQLELISLWNQINSIQNDELKNFFEVIFSSVIITKSGGVSLALDLGHTRPHKVKALLDSKGNVIYGNKDFDISKKRYNSKIIKSSFEEFKKRINQNIGSIISINDKNFQPYINFCDSQKLLLDDETVDLIITSPPYASNAIDYMRAHKFSLVWFGYKIDELTKKRNDYIGAEATVNYSFEELPEYTLDKIAKVSSVNSNRGKVLKRYFSEMKKSIKEMYRVLKPGKVAIVVVGSSMMKGIDTETHICLSEIGKEVGFWKPLIGIRKLDRNKRMLPVSKKENKVSQIQQRMHEEYVIGFYKP